MEHGPDFLLEPMPQLSNSKLGKQSPSLGVRHSRPKMALNDLKWLFTHVSRSSSFHGISSMTSGRIRSGTNTTPANHATPLFATHGSPSSAHMWHDGR